MNAGHTVSVGTSRDALDPDVHLPLTVLLRYLFFLSRRPISSSNRSFLVERVAALRALAALFSNRSSPVLDHVAADVRRLTPNTLAEVTREISSRVTALLPKEVADDVVVTHRRPDRDFLASTRRIRLILGPAIGIGDEAICLSLPAWLHTGAPHAEIHVLSTRPELWSAVAGITSIAPYQDLVEMVEALRGDGFDLVFLADFERPALATALSRGPAPSRYVELSLGAGTVEAFDAGVRCVHEFSRRSPYFANYYDFAEHALRWLGTTATLRDRACPVEMSQRLPTADRPQTIVVSPFTSKHEPSAAAWTALLGALLPAAAAGSVRLVFDAGPSLATERFALRLTASTRASVAAGIACELASEAPARTLTLPGVLRLISQADVVICADTFAAHIAPLSGCTTLVVASQALTNWRVPHAPVFYFDDEDAPVQIARGMRRVLAAHSSRFDNGWPSRPWCTPAGRELVAATSELSAAFATSAGGPTVLEKYAECSALLRELISELPDWPQDFLSIVTDRKYHRLLPTLRAAERSHDRAEWESDQAAHISHLLSGWENSNLHKYLLLATRTERR
jgi:hypothetical protein